MDQLKSRRAGSSRSPCTNFDNKKCRCTGEDSNLRVPLGETGLQPVRFGRAHALCIKILRR